jgi:hypothetical protein
MTAARRPQRGQLPMTENGHMHTFPGTRMLSRRRLEASADEGWD